MNKYKVCVYAIAKNEEKHVERWVQNMREADEIYVLLDATSTDSTEELLKKAGVHVTKKLIEPWRFDEARNESLNLVPKDADICVCTDIDEIFSPGWRKVLEETWTPTTNQALYNFWVNSYDESQPKNIFVTRKIHDRHNFYWKWIVHEFIQPKDRNKKINTVFLEDVLLHHYPDFTKPRNYDKLLEQAIELEPDDIYYQQLLAEEYLKRNELAKAEALVERIFKNPSNMAHPYNRCFNYKLACQVALEKKDYKKARQLCEDLLYKIDYCKWFYGALGSILIDEYYEYDLGIENMKKCYQIDSDVIDAREQEWNDKAFVANYISIAHYHLKEYEEALKWVNIAIQKTTNQRNREVYLENRKLYERSLMY